MAYFNLETYTLGSLSGDGSTAATELKSKRGYSKFRAYFVTTGFTASGYDVAIQVSPDGTNWANVAAPVTQSANGTTTITFDGPAAYVRATVSSHVDGACAAYLEAIREP